MISDNLKKYLAGLMAFGVVQESGTDLEKDRIGAILDDLYYELSGEGRDVVSEISMLRNEILYGPK